jgi:hypothetical protein
MQENNLLSWWYKYNYIVSMQTMKINIMQCKYDMIWTIIIINNDEQQSWH